MSISFPNPSRSYDEREKRVRFVGHDGMFEIPFFVGLEAYSKAAKAGASEVEQLAGFDLARKAIQDVAREAYTNSRKSMYVLTAADFR
jgi:hypothetical protein